MRKRKTNFLVENSGFVDVIEQKTGKWEEMHKEMENRDCMKNEYSKKRSNAAPTTPEHKCWTVYIMNLKP